jgi:hypothetical protein
MCAYFDKLYSFYESLTVVFMTKLLRNKRFMFSLFQIVRPYKSVTLMALRKVNEN